MKRILLAILATVALAGSLVALSAAPASAAGTVRGCAESQYYFPATGNGLLWSDAQQTFYTAMARAGACRHLYVVSWGVNNAPPCTMMKMNTYNEDRTLRVNGPWYRFEGVGRLGDLRPTIDNMRLYRVYAYGCDNFRNFRYTPGFSVYTHVG